MKLIYCLLLMLCPLLNRAQPPNINSLTIGDKLPDVSFTQLLNGKQKSSLTSSYKGKLLILDFMHTACVGCIQKLPLFSILQKQYDTSIQVILVTTQNAAAIKSFLQKSEIGRYLSLPFVTNDSVLRSIFPHEYISHLVWIGADGLVKAITHPEYLTAANIEEALKGHTLSWPVKNDLPEVDLVPPFLQLNGLNIPVTSQPAKLYYSAFYRHMPGMPEGIYSFTDSSTGTIKTLLVNQTIPDMYRRLYNQGRLPLSHIILQVPQKAFYVYSNAWYRAGWERYNSFSYEAVQPVYLSQQQRLAQVLVDINRYTQTTAYFTDTLVDGFVLKDTNTAILSLLYKRLTGDSVLSVSGLLYTLNNDYGLPPVNDGRHNPQPAWLIRQGKTDFTDMAALNRLLLAYGLFLQPQPQKIHALVITQTGAYPFDHSPKLYAK